MLKTQTLRVEIWSTEVLKNPLPNKWVQVTHRLGVTQLTDCFPVRVFFVRGTSTAADLNVLTQQLLADPVTESFAITLATEMSSIQTADHSIEVALLPGVTDSVAENLLVAAHRLGLEGIVQIATGIRYLLSGQLTGADLNLLAQKVFSNPVIQHYAIDRPVVPGFVHEQLAGGLVEIVKLQTASDDQLREISRERRLALDLDEMLALQAYFIEAGRDPTDVELETIAQTWSEHCVHKTFKAHIDYLGPAPGSMHESHVKRQAIDGLLNTYIQAATEQVNKDWVVSAFVDNAGIIRFDDQFDLAFKVETHNHPSAVEPFGGANTGVGGVVRDVLGVSARPIANTDVLCFGPDDVSPDTLPNGVIHPSLIADGVIHGVEDYSNKMGIPTVNGAVLYHAGYTANPLVFCGCLGILPRGAHPTAVQADDLIVVIGGRTGRDGLRGATFSSMEMDGTTGEIAGSSVQIGHPIHEKQVQEVIIQARDAQLYHAITDCGAGGLSSAVGEMGEAIGATVQLETVPLKYAGLRPWEIWLSEAQERMVLAVAPQNWDALQGICAGQDVEATCIGTFEPTGKLLLTYNDNVVCEMAMKFLYDGLPPRHMTAEWSWPQIEVDVRPPLDDFKTSLLKLLAHPNIRSKETIVRRYDHEVQGGTVVKPMVGAAENGHGDGSVLVPLVTRHETRRGVALANGVCPQYGEYDPYAMAWAAVDEAFRNLVAVGADPDQVALLDNFCWGNPQLPDRLGSLVRAAQGCYDAAIAYQAPFISGKDSLNNEYMGADGQRQAIPGTLLISATGIVPDVRQTVTMDFKAAGNDLYLIGATKPELGGSHYNLLYKQVGGVVPQPAPAALDTMRQLHQAIRAGYVQACHDLSEGGLAVALAEMCIAGELGATVDLPTGLPAHESLFSETTGRFLIEARPSDAKALSEIVSASYLGRVSAAQQLVISDDTGLILEASISELENAWRGESLTTEIDQVLTTPSKQAIKRSPIPHTQPKVLVLHANGTNRDHEAALACEMAGGLPEIVHVNQLIGGDRHLLDYHMLVVPGGFSYGDDLGAGVLWAQDLQQRLDEDMQQFVSSGRPVLGICNGFQALVKAGLLPGAEFSSEQAVTLTYNESGRFECRWVYLQPNRHSPSLFTHGLDDLIYCPVAHGEGRLVTSGAATLQSLWDMGLVTLTYVDHTGSSVGYPGNPNGSASGIAALCNPAGNVMGLMPHPEDHIFSTQHPRWHRGESGLFGLPLFENGIKFA